MGRVLKECTWKIHINRSYRIKFDVDTNNLQLYSFSCFKNYMTGMGLCSDNITIYYDECSPGKEIISYPRTKDGPSSFIGNTDTLCFHFVPSRQSSLNGMMFRRRFYLRIGIAVLASYCDDRGSLNGHNCAGICYANGTKVSPCSSKAYFLWKKFFQIVVLSWGSRRFTIELSHDWLFG